MNILIVSPHRDDAAFSLTLSIDAWLHAGHAVTVMNCFTRSTYAPFADALSVHPNDLLTFVTALRQREDESWRKQRQTKGLRFHDLHLKDAPLRFRCPLEEICIRPVDASDKAFVRIHRAMNETPYDALVLPLALGGHVDHRTARDAAMQIGHKPFAFYEDLPYAAWSAVTPTIEREAQVLADANSAALTPMFADRLEPHAAVAQKLRAALCYDSQIDNAAAELLSGFSQTYAGAERLWVDAAWGFLQPSLSRNLETSIA